MANKILRDIIKGFIFIENKQYQLNNFFINGLNPKDKHALAEAFYNLGKLEYILYNCLSSSCYFSVALNLGLEVSKKELEIIKKLKLVR